METGNERFGTEILEKRGNIFRDTSIGDGIVSVDGVQHTYGIGKWKSFQPPRVGMIVDVGQDAGGHIVSLREVPDSVLAREQAQQAIAGARHHGAALVGGIKSRFPVAALVANLILLVAFFMMPIVGMGNGFGRQTFTGWETIGFDPGTMNPNDHGVLSLLAIVCLFAPLGVPFLKKWWTRFLYCAPLLFVVLTMVTIIGEIMNAGRSAGRMAGDVFGGGFGRQVSSGIAEMFHPAAGAFVVIACAIYLSTRTFKTR